MMMFDDETKQTREELNGRKSEEKIETPIEADEDVYPPKKVVIPAFLALALSFFVVALVGLPSHAENIQDG